MAGRTDFLGPELARTTTCECRDLPEPVLLAGCVPLHDADLLEPLQNRSDPVYQLMIDLGRNYLLAEGFIVNTMDALEHETLVAYKELSNKGVYPPAYAVGPFTRRWCPDSDEVNHSCLRWLDNQPDGSVLYVSFGSGGTLSTAQTAEQRMNAVMLSSDRVGLALWERPPLGKDGVVVPREEVAALVRELMEGEKGAAARKKAGHLRDEAEIASAPGGPQDRALAVVAGMVSLHRKSRAV
ncbi:UDP-glycosyltransferase 72B1-like [Aegilops tauschii subsp. strangulata]|uniref:UDP-glycosyltransferase 72B1-like n=1 Tax=Aegilops tauschii subsp. strangulata TaxID=200361 RepID=UPI003CC8BF0D